MMEPYHERCGWPLSCRVAFLALVIGAPAIVAFSNEPHALLVAIPAVLGLSYVAYRFSWVEFRVGDDGIEYGFRGLRNEVPWRRVRSLKVEEYPFSRYLGWGYRVGGRRDRAYSVIGPSSGVRLRFVDEKEREWSVFLSSVNPEAAVEASIGKIS